MAQYIDKAALVAEIIHKIKVLEAFIKNFNGISDKVEKAKNKIEALNDELLFIESLKVKEVNLIIHTIIAECCDWLAVNTNLSHDEIEGCRNLMLTVKEEQLKAQKGEKV